MTTSSISARHRAARRPITQRNSGATSVVGNAASVGRRTAIVAASSGLIASLMGAAPASAATAESADFNVASVDIAALKSEARAALSTAPAVTVAADASWTIEETDLVVTPAPTPPPPAPTRAQTRAAARTAERAATTPVAAPIGAEVPASAVGSSVIEIAARYVGTPYVSGGSTPSGFDCSGFTSYVYAQLGITLPRTSGGQAGAGTVVSREDAQPGDLIFTPGHIAIYAGGNSQIDSPRPGKTIQFREIYQTNPVFIRIG